MLSFFDSENTAPTSRVWPSENDPPPRHFENNPWPADQQQSLSSNVWSPLKSDFTLKLLDDVPPSPFITNAAANNPWSSNVFSFDFDFKATSNVQPLKTSQDRPVFGELSNGAFRTPPSSPGFSTAPSSPAFSTVPGSPAFQMPPSPLVTHTKGASVIPQLERFSTKVFIGGIPAGTTIAELEFNLGFYGQCVVDWPNRLPEENCPPNGYAFVTYSSEHSVLELFDACVPNDDGKLVFTVASPDGALKFTELKFWEIKNTSCVCMPNYRQFMRLSTFVGGLPRSCTAAELRDILEQDIGPVAHIDIEVDNITGYPKGAARVIFSQRESFLKAMAMKEMMLSIHNMQRRVELKPFLYARMSCESCQAPQGALFCNEVRCLRYFCQQCWKVAHARPGMSTHQPMRRGQQKRGGVGVGGAKGTLVSVNN